MAKSTIPVGVCEACGNTGLPGERCPCGGMMVDLDAGIEKFEDPDRDPQKYPDEMIDSDGSLELNEE